MMLLAPTLWGRFVQTYLLFKGKMREEDVGSLKSMIRHIGEGLDRGKQRCVLSEI